MLLAAACSRSPVTMEIAGEPPEDIVASLEDEVRPIAGGRVAWRTWWSMCWAAYPGARSYELQVLTGEGISPRLRRADGRCVRIEAVAGEDPGDIVPERRSMLLALQEGQLAYQVRAVLDGSRRSPWSEPFPVGRATS
jgi:hypothetical protein